MIKNFGCKETEKLFYRHFSRHLPANLHRISQRKLAILDAADCLEDLRLPPGNHLEKLTGNRKGQYSIRINDQWRICFRWCEGNAHNVEIADYH